MCNLLPEDTTIYYHVWRIQNKFTFSVPQKYQDSFVWRVCSWMCVVRREYTSWLCLFHFRCLMLALFIFGLWLRVHQLMHVSELHTNGRNARESSLVHRLRVTKCVLELECICGCPTTYSSGFVCPQYVDDADDQRLIFILFRSVRKVLNNLAADGAKRQCFISYFKVLG